VFVEDSRSMVGWNGRESLTWGTDGAGDGGEDVGGVLGGNEGAGGDDEDGGELHGD
jgi:hypothetical protein